MAALLAAESDLAPLHVAEPGLESDSPAVEARLRAGGLHWLRSVSKRAAVAAAVAAVLLFTATVSLSSLRFQPRPREAEIRKSVELAEVNATAKVLAAKGGWAAQFQRSQATTFNQMTTGPRLVQRIGFDYLHVYVDPGAECSIVFAGSNTLYEDCIGPEEMTDVPECAMTRVYKCYLRETTKFWKDPQWTEVVDLLTSPTCQGGVNAVGWSLGGTIAGIFATCANHAKDGMLMLDGKEVRLPRVASLVTFAAPDIGEGVQPLNGQSPNGVFKGIRMWNEMPGFAPGKVTVDGCAWEWEGVNRLLGVHPKMWAMSIREPYVGGPTQATLYKPNTQVAMIGKTSYKRSGICPGPLHLTYSRTITRISSVKMGS